MKHNQDFFEGVYQKKIYYQNWLPDEKPKAVILIIHGIVEHSNRYMNVVNYFVPKNFAVYGFDHMGHGKSEGERTYINQFEDFRDNIKRYFDMVREWHPDIPIILFGHSMGALISANYLLDYQHEFSAAVLSAAPVILPNIVTQIMGNILASIAPNFGLIRINPHDMSRDKAVVQAYIDDPMVYNGRIAVRLLAEIVKGMKRINEEASKIQIPLCIVHGGADKVADAAGSQMLFDRVQSEKKNIFIYDNLLHEVLNEPEHQAVLDDIANSLNSYLF